ncbi:hypothetical protein GG344DRAFT_74459 [Lentinula edodes]|nr:hypothetical protein GG344DRAFT_74459 [Lentinula edodes]
MASSLSIFSRPLSPPPRAVSPDVATLGPLPLPPARSRRMSERSGPSSRSSPPRSLLRSTPSKGILKPTPPPSPGSPVSFASSSSSSSSSTSSRGSTHTLSHRRSIQFAIPYRSPPASPTLAASPPPVPPIPAFALNSGAARPLPGDQLAPLPPRPARSPRRELHDGSRGGMTCSQFMSIPQHGLGRRNPTQAPNTA